MLKKIISIIMVLTLVVSLTVTAGAWDDRKFEGIYTYNTKLGYATLYGIDESVKGDIVIPSVLGGAEVKIIGYSALSMGENITSVVIPDGVFKIDERAFIYCTKIRTISIPDTVRSLGNDVFLGCESLTEVVIPDSVTTIGSMAFANIPNLERVVIYDSVSSIGELAFIGSPNVTVYGYSGTYAEEYAKANEIPFLPLEDVPEEFDKAGQTEGLYTYSTVNGKAIITGVDDSASGNIEIPDNLCGYPVIEISEYAFAGKDKICGLVIPEGVSYVGENAFSYCTNLCSVTIPSTLTMINYDTFRACENLKSVVISEGVKYIGGSAFVDCQKLDDLILPSSIVTIGDNAFERCGLREVVIPDFTREIGFRAFGFCDQLANVTMPQNLTRIEDNAFEGCGRPTVDPVIMHVYSRTLAHKYVHKEGIRYVRIDGMIGGDVNQNGSLNIADVSDALKVIAKWSIETNKELVDVNADESVNLSDVTLMLKAIAGWKDIYLY